MGSAQAVLESAPEAVQKEAATIDARIAEFQARRRKPASQTPPPDASPAVGTDGVSADETGKPAASSTVTPPAQPVPGGTESGRSDPDKIARLEQEVVELRRQVDVANGKVGGTVLPMKDRLVELERQLKAVQDQLAQATKVVAAPARPASEKPWLDGIAQEDIDKWGEDFFFKAYQAGDSERRRILDEIALLKARPDQSLRLNRLERQVRAQRFWLEVDRLSSGASVTNGDPDDVVNKPPAEGWGQFLDSTVRTGGLLTWRDEAQRAIDSGDAKAMASIHDEFQKSRKVVKPRTDVREQVVPASVPGKQPVPDAGKKRMIPESEIQEWRDKCAKAQPGEISFEVLEAKTREYREAYAERRVTRG